MVSPLVSGAWRFLFGAALPSFWAQSSGTWCLSFFQPPSTSIEILSPSHTAPFHILLYPSKSRFCIQSSSVVLIFAEPLTILSIFSQRGSHTCSLQWTSFLLPYLASWQFLFLQKLILPFQQLSPFLFLLVLQQLCFWAGSVLWHIQALIVQWAFLWS